jgi:hypothetical protein
LWQIVSLAGSLFAAATGVVWGVWITTHDLSLQVQMLSTSVGRLDASVSALRDDIADKEARLRVLENATR